MDNQIPAWAQTLIESNKALTKEVATLRNRVHAGSRSQQLEAAIEKASPALQRATRSTFDRMRFETDEDFAEYLAELDQLVAEDVQSRADSGLGVDAPAKAGKTSDKDVSPFMQSFLNQQKQEATE